MDLMGKSFLNLLSSPCPFYSRTGDLGVLVRGDVVTRVAQYVSCYDVFAPSRIPGGGVVSSPLFASSRVANAHLGLTERTLKYIVRGG